MNERLPTSAETAPAPRLGLLQARLNSLKADIAETVRGIIDAGGKRVTLHLSAAENESPWTDQELAIVRGALLKRYGALGIDFIVAREELDMEAMMAEMMKDDGETTVASTVSNMTALRDTAAELPVMPKEETGKKPILDSSAAAANLLEEMKRLKKKKPS